MLTKSPLFSVALRYGAISGLLAMVFVISLYYMDKHPFLVSAFLDPRIVVLGFMLFFGLKELRDFYQSGSLYFAQGMVTSFLITLLCAVVCWAGILGFATLDEGFVRSFVSQATEQAKNISQEDIQRIGQDVFDKTMSELQKADKHFMAERYFFQTFIIGFFVSLVVTIVLRRTPSPA
jgi:hypothetical protein